MPLKATCPEGHVITVPESKAGKLVRCPQCEKFVLVLAAREDKKPPPLDEPTAPPVLPVEPAVAVAPPMLPVTKRETASEELRQPASPPPLPKTTSPESAELVERNISEEPAEVESRPKRRGMRHDSSHVATAYWLGVALIVAALVGLIPAIMEFADHFRHADTSAGIARWAYLLVLLGAVQIAYAIYVMQLPDWGTVWVVTAFSLLVAAGYATLLGFLLLSAEPSRTLGFLQLADGLRQKAISWCFLMLCLNCLVTYLGGRSAAGWYRAHATVSAALARNANRVS